MVHDGQEKDKYKKLTLEYMSAESSSDETGNAIVVHRPIWRSDSKHIKPPFLYTLLELTF